MLQLAIKAQCCATPVNADGFGICWYIPDVYVPGVFKDITPGIYSFLPTFKKYVFLAVCLVTFKINCITAWNNPNLKQIARAIKSHCFFAHVRAASTGNYPENTNKNKNKNKKQKQKTKTKTKTKNKNKNKNKKLTFCAGGVNYPNCHPFTYKNIRYYLIYY